jgi:hypothetical protein
MSHPSLDAYQEIASSLTPSAVSQYLATQSWELESRQDHIREIWRLPDEADHRGRIMLPLAVDYADSTQRFRDALYAIGKINDWDPDRVQERIVAAHADLFFIRLDQAMLDGTIPFRQAEQTIESINRMLKAAATTAANPHHSLRGRRPAGVNEFLEEDVRLGHTKRGSFIFTVVARLSSSEPAHTDQTASASGQDLAAPFPRKVMETLARGLESTRDLTTGQGSHDYMKDPGRWGLSAGLVESLEEMTAAEGLRSVDLTFDWAASQPRPQVGAEPIVLSRSLTPELARVRERLVRKEEPPRSETLVGHVRRLAREDGDDEETGTVIISADVNGRVRNITMTLSGSAHDWAIFAYREKIPLTVTGDLVFERRSWQLKNPQVDSSFLEHRQQESRRQDAQE